METTTEEAQRVVLIQDASREVSTSAVRWIMDGFSLKAGDVLTLLLVLHQVNNPMGYRSRVDSSIFGANQKIINDEIARTTKEYEDNIELVQITKLYEMQKIEFKIQVHAGPSPKVAGLEFAKKLSSTWVILDRQLKKDRRYFLENLSCGISRMKRNNSIEKLRGPKPVKTGRCSTERRVSFSTQVSYDEMLPGSAEDAGDLFSIELGPKNSTSTLGSPLSTRSSLSEVSTEKSRISIYGKETVRPPHEEPRTSLSEASTEKSRISISQKETVTPLHEEPRTSLREASTEKSRISISQKETVRPLHEETRTSLSEASTEKSRISISIRETARPLHEETNSIRQKFPFDNNGMNGDQKNVTESLNPDTPMCTICKNARPIIESKTGIFSYTKLVQATNGFSAENLISRGAYGEVFRGKLKSRLNIAVKQQRDASIIGEKKFQTEVQTLTKIRHKNIVMLLGSSSGNDHRFLVYEYVCYGSLDQHISGQSRNPLTWQGRMKIAEGMSRGLNHLHENKILHRDVTPKNVLLTHDFEPVLGGFGLARTLLESEREVDRHVVGSFGYLAPEYAESGKATTKSDVYSFGVVLLELITGRSITDKSLEGKSLLQWARPLLKEMKCDELIDPRIADSHNRRQFMSMVQVAGKCLSKDPRKRFSMDQVVSTLELIAEGKTFDEIDTSAHEKSNSSSSSTRATPDEDGQGGRTDRETDAIDPSMVLATPLPKQAREYFQNQLI